MPESFSISHKRMTRPDLDKLIDKKPQDAAFWNAIPIVELTAEEKAVYQTLKNANSKGNLYK